MPAKRIVRAAAVQISPDLERPGGTLDKVCEMIDDAARQGVQLIVFPETFLPYYPYFSFVRTPVASGPDHMRLYDEAVVVPGPVTDILSERARRHGMVIVMGVNERDHGSLYNAQLIFDTDGALLLKRRKITPTFHERMIWGMGDAAGLKLMLASTSSAVYALCAPDDPAAGEEVSEATVLGAIEALSRDMPYVVLDTGAGIDAMTLLAVEHSTDLVFVGSLDVPSVRSVRQSQ